MARPRKYDDSTRDLLIAEAAATIAQLGGDGLALRPLAERAGCSTSTIYSLFGSREQLVAEVTAHVVESFVDSQQAVPRTSEPLEDLRALGTAYRQWALAHPAFYAIMFGGAGKAADCPPSTIRPEASIEPLVDGVERAMQRGALAGGTTEQITMSIWAGVHGWVQLELGGMTPVGPRRAVTAYRAHLESLLNAWRNTRSTTV